MKYLSGIIAIIGIIGVGMAVNACDDDSVYRQEMYKQVLALICSDDYNILTDTQELTGEEVISYVAVSCGGSFAPKEDVYITLKEDEGVLDAYNLDRYFTDVTRYANRLPASKFDIDDYQIVIPKGERSGKMKIRFRPDGLSPDSVYFLPISFRSNSAYEVNPKKENMLYRVLIKNQYAEQFSTGYTEYKMNGYKGTTNITTSKQMQPLSANRARMMAGDISFSSSVSKFNEGAIVLEVTGNSVKITPYKENGSLIITQMDNDPDYPNMFNIVREWDRKFKVFLLHYKYKAGTAAEVEMREELKLEITD